MADLMAKVNIFGKMVMFTKEILLMDKDRATECSSNQMAKFTMADLKTKKKVAMENRLTSQANHLKVLSKTTKDTRASSRQKMVFKYKSLHFDCCR